MVIHSFTQYLCICNLWSSSVTEPVTISTVYYTSSIDLTLVTMRCWGQSWGVQWYSQQFRSIGAADGLGSPPVACWVHFAWSQHSDVIRPLQSCSDVVRCCKLSYVSLQSKANRKLLWLFIWDTILFWTYETVNTVISTAADTSSLCRFLRDFF